ncbi:MAG: hypothetical protein KAI47_05715 [Deltaproteobacteria bacterium]|nr:hypothetical protein [Deltaproteobacteria bacterium]
MYLTGLIQRQRLFDLATRWFAGDLHPDDGRLLSEIFVYERLLLEPPLRRLLTSIAAPFSETPTTWTRFANKDVLRSALCADPRARQSGDDVATLCRRAHENSEALYAGTPADLLALSTGRDVPGDTARRLRGLIKVKRLRRLSQRARVLVSEAIGARIRAAARDLARQRAETSGLPLNGFFTPPEAMTAEFAHAEDIVADAIRAGDIIFTQDDLTIDDIFGISLVADSDAELDAQERRLRAIEGVRLIETTPPRESGEIPERTLLVELTLPSPETLVAPWANSTWAFAKVRGLDPQELAAGILPYAERGARTVRVEVQLTRFDALARLELGDNPPEARIVDEMRRGRARGRIAENAAYIIEYLLIAAISQRRDIDTLPLSLGGRYVPDAIAVWVGELFAETSPATRSFVSPPEMP